MWQTAPTTTTTLHKICYSDSASWFAVVSDQIGEAHAAENGEKLLGAESGL